MTWSVPGKGEYSFMNVLAGYGFDVWTMDHDGYGRSGSSGNNSDIASGVADLKAAIPVVVQETGQQRLHMYGTSSGAIRAGAYAQAAPERVDRLILSAFTYKGTGSPEIARRNAVADRYRNSPRRKRDLAMIRSIFTRDGHASAYEQGGRGRDRRRGAEVRRSGADPHLSRHGGQPAAGRSREGAIPRC